MSEKFSTFTFFQGDYLKEFHLDKYSFKPEDVDFNRMYSDIALFMKLAVKNGYQMRVWHDEYCVVIEYNAQDESLSGVSLEWVGDNEYVAEYEQAGTFEETMKKYAPEYSGCIPEYEVCEDSIEGK